MLGVGDFLRVLNELTRGGKCRRLARVFVALANIDGEFRELSRDWNFTAQFNLRREAPFHIRFQGGRAELVDGEERRAQLVVEGHSDMFYKVAVGGLSLMAVGVPFRLVGPVQYAYKLQRAFQLVASNHAETLAALRGFVEGDKKP